MAVASIRASLSGLGGVTTTTLVGSAQVAHWAHRTNLVGSCAAIPRRGWSELGRECERGSCARGLGSRRRRAPAWSAWELLLDQSDAIADSITLTLFERDAEVYEHVGPELRADVRQSTRQHIRRGLQILSGGRGW